MHGHNQQRTESKTKRETIDDLRHSHHRQCQCRPREGWDRWAAIPPLTAGSNLRHHPNSGCFLFLSPTDDAVLLSAHWHPQSSEVSGRVRLVSCCPLSAHAEWTTG